MSELDRTAWAREAKRIEKAIAHRRERAASLDAEIRDLSAKYDTLLGKIADDYDEERRR